MRVSRLGFEGFSFRVQGDGMRFGSNRFGVFLGPSLLAELLLHSAAVRLKVSGISHSNCRIGKPWNVLMFVCVLSIWEVKLSGNALDPKR